MTALSAGASLTRYHSRYPAFDGAKVVLFRDMSKFLPQPQNACKSAIYKHKNDFPNCIPNRKMKKQIETSKNQIEKGCPIGNLYKNQIDHLENENEKNNPLD